MKQRVMGEVKKLFRPEFLNRIDEIIVFKSLTEEEIVKIVDLMIADLRERLIEQNMSINLTPEASRFVAKEGTDLSFGARPLRRAIQRLIEDPLSEQLLEGRWSSGSVIDVDVEDDKLVFNAGTGSIPAPRKRDTIAAELNCFLPAMILVTRVFLRVAALLQEARQPTEPEVHQRCGSESAPGVQELS